MNLRCLSFLFLLLLLQTAASAQPRLPYFFSDNMVLQRNTDVKIWGTSQAGKRVQVSTSWNKKNYAATADSNGNWEVRASTPGAGGPYTIRVSDGRPVEIRNVMIGEVWLCSGQSNMEMPMKGYRDQPIRGSNDAIFESANPMIRLYTVPRSVKLRPQDTSKASPWKIAQPESVSEFSATAWYFGKMLQERLNVPVGLINISYGGSTAEAWMSTDALRAFPSIKLPTAADSASANNRTATTLYNGMLHPFIGYGIKGCIWYQGESNFERAEEYETLFPAMVQQWRKEFGQGDFPFYFVQIAPYNYSQLPPYYAGGKYNSAFLRDAQRKAQRLMPNSGMVSLLDAGEENSIHPADKQTPGKRLAYLALAKTYGEKGFGFASPDLDTMTVTGNIATIKFRDAPNGLTSFGRELRHFEIAGADKVFRPANAVIRRGTVVVSSPDVREPVAVRYAFRDFVSGDLFSTEGLPVSSFRTDDW